MDHVPDYLAHLRRILPDPRAARGLRIAVDCANGATVAVAPELFSSLGADAHLLGCTPDGRNINAGVGSTAPQALAAAVTAGGYRLGVAFDGDGDRAIFVDANGRIVDGDAIMLLCARQMQAEGRLKGGTIVATVMSLPNIGPLLLRSLIQQDMYLAGSILLIYCMLTIVGTLISDILLALFDPRIRMEGT